MGAGFLLPDIQEIKPKRFSAFQMVLLRSGLGPKSAGSFVWPVGDDMTDEPTGA